MKDIEQKIKDVFPNNKIEFVMVFDKLSPICRTKIMVDGKSLTSMWNLEIDESKYTNIPIEEIIFGEICKCIKEFIEENTI
jgi:hypothetical protein